MGALEWAFLILAIYRVARMLALERGPFDVFMLVRSFHADRHDWISSGLNCIACIGVWVSLVAALFVNQLTPLTWQMFIVTWLGLSGAVVIIAKVIGDI